MSNGTANSYGNYTHADGARRTKKHGDRTFSVMIAGAEVAGITGPEYNGIVIIDEDNRSIVLDRHVKESTGYFGPTQRQWDEMGRIMRMDWADFRQFIKSNPRYREKSVPDIDMDTPDPVIPIADRVIYPKEGRAETGPYVETLENRKGIIEFIRDHKVHRIDGPYSRWALAWDIKVPAFDTSGKNCHDEFKANEAYDARWEKYVETNGELFHEACGAATRQYHDGEYNLYPGVNEDSYKFGQTGRSGGWMLLTEFDGFKGYRFSWEDLSELEEWLQNLTDDKLVHLYRLVNQLDADLGTDKIRANMEYQFAFLREQQEEQWGQEDDLDEDDELNHDAEQPSSRP